MDVNKGYNSGIIRADNPPPVPHSPYAPFNTPWYIEATVADTLINTAMSMSCLGSLDFVGYSPKLYHRDTSNRCLGAKLPS